MIMSLACNYLLFERNLIAISLPEDNEVRLSLLKVHLYCLNTFPKINLGAVHIKVTLPVKFLQLDICLLTL